MNRPEPTHPTARPRAQAWLRNFRSAGSLYLAVSAGAVIGSVLRALVSLASLAMFGPGFPWGTLFVNVVGSFVIGFYSTLTGPDGRLLAGSRARQFVMAGICGGFTTFSTFSLETLRLAQSGHWPMAGLNVIISVITWLFAVWLGHMFATRLNRLGGI
ncbi:fluoride efflux transporter CrcB [Pseudaminobacter soli (ex Li et al. 2025)]|uniref:Fluoride-specific ion channel FluC n=1 Tax=Pseudaminobacter soli (ex Li et al. 2025) TaxID=1295366 RepID=A0A2P7SKL8_9HYPH|nr:fluoride efflux transporter CrcB [Mesorhizobium soli]PSJ63028.1 fluoride efflux transporter CrcB [Mesorhizobium soli]